MEILQKPEFWDALVSLAWPLVALVIATRFKSMIEAAFRRDKLTIKVAGMEISVADATEQAGKSLSDLQERVARIEERASQATSSQAPPLTTVSLIEPPGERAILWVDDYPSNNAFIIDKLETMGIRVRKEISTDAGLKALASDNFSLVISDLGRMEGGKNNPFAGLELIRAMRAASHKQPVLIFAGPRGLENQDRLIKAGANAVTSSAIDVFAFVEKHVQV